MTKEQKNERNKRKRKNQIISGKRAEHERHHKLAKQKRKRRLSFQHGVEE